jgi:hypothetical protein
MVWCWAELLSDSYVLSVLSLDSVVYVLWYRGQWTALWRLWGHVRGGSRAATCEFDWEGVLYLRSACHLVCTCLNVSNL